VGVVCAEAAVAMRAPALAAASRTSFDDIA
jgi:hypothetical protein